MYPGRSLVPVAIGISTLSWRTEIWELAARFLIALVRWLIHRVEVAAAEAELRAIISWSVSGLIFYLLIVLGCSSSSSCTRLVLWWVEAFVLLPTFCQRIFDCCCRFADWIVQLISWICNLQSRARLAQPLHSTCLKGPFLHSPIKLAWMLVSFHCRCPRRRMGWGIVSFVTTKGSEWLLLFDGPEWHQISLLGFWFAWTLGEFQNSGRERWQQGSASGNCARETWTGCATLAILQPNGPPSPGLLVNLCSEGRIIMDIVKAEVQPPTRPHSGKLRGLCGTDQSSSGASAGPGTTTCGFRLGRPWEQQGLDLQPWGIPWNCRKLAEVVNSLRSEIEEGKSKKKKGKKRRNKGRKRSSSSNSSSSFQPKFEQQQLCEMEDEWQKAEKCQQWAWGRWTPRSSKRDPTCWSLRRSNPGALTANFINALRQKTDERRNCPYQPAERHIEMTEFVHDRGRRLEGGEGSARSTHHIAVDGLHQPRRSGEGDGRFCPCASPLSSKQKLRAEHGTRLQRRSWFPRSQPDWLLQGWLVWPDRAMGVGGGGKSWRLFLRKLHFKRV